MLSRRHLGILATAACLPVLSVLFSLTPNLERSALCAPSARLASLYWGVPLHPTDNGFLLPLSLPVEVTKACSGAGFMALLLSVLIGLGVERQLSLRGFLILLPLAYLAGLLANAIRIVTVCYVDRISEFFLPVALHAGVHAMTGALVFLCALTAVYLLTWRILHAN